MSVTHYLRATVDGIAIGKNTLITDSPKLNIRNSDVSNVTPMKIVFWGSDVNIEKYIDIYHDFIFLTSFNHSASNIYPLLNGEFNLNNIYSELKINSLLVEGGNYLHKFLLNNLKYDSFYWFKSSKKITNGYQLSDPILNKLNTEYKVINKFPLKDNQLTTYTYI